LKPRLITIDGPVAAGKSSVGSLLAQRLGYSFFDTGIMYRAFTWKALESHITPKDEPKLRHLAKIIKFDFVSHRDGYLFPLINREDVSAKLFDPKVERQVSLISQIAVIRQAMVTEQRKLAKRGAIVMAGRDIGTVVLPEAELKIFLVATIEKRAQRRYKEQSAQKGKSVNYNDILADLAKRDDADIHRTISPLKPAADAITVDTDKLSLEQVVDRIYALAVG
jgi:cytidylate kinase